jgi:hypothetical protein
VFAVLAARENCGNGWMNLKRCRKVLSSRLYALSIFPTQNSYSPKTYLGYSEGIKSD